MTVSGEYENQRIHRQRRAGGGVDFLHCAVALGAQHVLHLHRFNYGERFAGLDLLSFGDAIALAFWINGTDSADCCAFSGGPFVESRYFGEGVGIGVRKGNDLLRQSLNWALFRLWEKGRYTDLWLRYFSVSPF